MASKFNAAFWKWFGDSKVVDAKGKPLVVYHGSALPLTKKDGSWKEMERQLESGEYFTTFRSGLIYFAENPTYASGFAQLKANVHRYGNNGFVIPAYLKIENPLDWRGYRNAWKELRSDGAKIRENLISNGRDGVLMHETEPEDVGGLIWVAFYPTQIKSATGNDGTWDADDSDIRSNPGYEIVPGSDIDDPFVFARDPSGKPIGGLWVKDFDEHRLRQWLQVLSVEVDGTHRKQGVATALYHSALKALPKEYLGLAAYTDERVNKGEIDTIYAKLGGYEDDGIAYLPRKKR